LTKTFGGAPAVQDIELSIAPGEVHGLLGENGSGKSTLIKVLCGYHAPDPGAELEIGGEPVALPLTPGSFRSLGLSFVHQDLGLVPELSVLENLRVAEVVARRGAWISWRAERRRARDAFARFGVDIDPGRRVNQLGPTDRALLAIVRAVEGIRTVMEDGKSRAGLLVLDEPTVFLPKDGVERLFEVVREIAHGMGASVLFVSHDLTEVLAVTDRVTVLRDGRVQGTRLTCDTSQSQLVEMIVGRQLEDALLARGSRERKTTPSIVVRDLKSETVEIELLEVHRGEILGLTGLAGSGFELVPYLLFGARRCLSGVLGIDGDEVALTEMTPARAIARRMALLPADRLTEGSLPTASVGDNVMVPVLNRYTKVTGLRRKRLASDARRLLERFDVRPPDPTIPLEALSGGNQQKAILAKWLQMEPQLILLHEPTQGVDVGARAHIFSILREVAAQGASVICASTDHEQLATLCDRVAVFSAGKMTKTVSADVGKDGIAESVYSSARLGTATERGA
jgi:ribose transport system ATP-binding protein